MLCIECDMYMYVYLYIYSTVYAPRIFLFSMVHPVAPSGACSQELPRAQIDLRVLSWHHGVAIIDAPLR